MDVQSEKVLAQVIRGTRIAALGTLRNEAPQVSMVAYIFAKDFSAFYIFVSTDCFTIKLHLLAFLRYAMYISLLDVI